VLGWGALLVLAACTGRFTSPPEPGERDGAQPQCGEIAATLRVEPAERTAGAGQLVTLRASGGTGRYRWELAESPSGGSIDADTGVYVAGVPDAEQPSTIDVVRLRDLGCRGEAVASITVVEAPSIAPRRIAVRPGQAVTFVGSGGSGRYGFTLVAPVSGGALDATGRYRAGTRRGTDVVRLEDEELGMTADATIEVSADAGLALEPTEWVVPVGSTLPLPVLGGSGELEVTVAGDGVEAVEGSTLRAIAPGEAIITFLDRFTRESVVARVRAELPHEAERRPSGDRMETHVVHTGAYDIDGDGLLDAVVGMPDADGEWFQSGLVLVYRGRMGGGLDPVPSRRISGSSRDEELGSALAIADLDEDGLLDLLVGARRADPIRRDVGAVYLYLGVAGGFFADAPARTWTGLVDSDLFGFAIAVCDFNADGHLDLAVGAPQGQRPGAPNDQGVVRLFLQREDSALRYASTPDVTLGGATFDGAAWVPTGTLRFGEALAAGDFDGDGACDLAVHQRGPTAAQLSSGAVALFRGRPAVEDDRGGLVVEPAVVWGRADGTADSGRFGQALAIGDVDGDGREDLLAARPRYASEAGNDAGALYVLRGRALEGPAARVTDFAEDAWWTFEGGSGDRVGHAVALFDVDRDGFSDLVSGDIRDALPMGTLTRPGLVRIFRGGPGGIPDTPTRELEGVASDDRFGAGVGALGDVDGDGVADLLAFAPYADTLRDGTSERDDRGALHLVPSRAGSEPVELVIPRPASGQRVGQSVAWIGDLDGDGFPELAVGASQADVAGLGFNVGVVRLYRGSSEGASAMPAQVLAGFAGHGEGDELGWAVAPAGDFDGDGAPDLAVLARSEDLPTMLDAEVYDVGAGCERRDNASAVLVFRGRSDGTVQPEPSFVYFGPEANQRFEALAGGLDVDGDGLGDLVVGGREWDAAGSNRGGVAVVRGRPAVAGRILALCEPDRIAHGSADGVRLGTAVTALGDIDGDGCDEYAAGAPLAAPNGVRNAGEVQVFFPACAASATTDRVVRLIGRDLDAEGGGALAGGVDLDGDAVPDLVIGLPRYRDGRGEVGRAILVRGAELLARDGALFADDAATGVVADGSAAGERMGSAIAVGRRGSVGLVLLGGPFGDAAGRVNTGGVVGYAVGPAGFASAPALRMSGESRGQSELGAALDARTSGGSVRVAVGAPRSTGDAWVDDGASYAFVMAP
jgi:hypothetical protein